MSALTRYVGLPIPLDGGYRGDVPPIFLEGHAETCPLNDSPEMLNCIFHNGRNRKWPGRVKYCAKPVLGGVGLDTAAAVVLIQAFPLSSGSSVLVVSDGRDLWRYYDSTEDDWLCITRLYVTGTATFTPDSATVTGADTLWSSAEIVPGAAIKCDADGEWYEILSVEADGEIILTAPYAETGGAGKAYTIRCRLSSTGRDWVRATVARELFLVVNGVDTPLKWDGDTDTMELLATGAPKGRFITSYHQENLLVIARHESDARLLAHSDVDDYAEWAEGYAADYPFRATPGMIMGVDGVAESLYLFKQDGVFEGRWTGSYTRMQWSQFTGVTDGPIAAKSLLRWGNFWGYFGEASIYAFDGHEELDIGEAVREWVFGEDGLDRAYADRVVGVIQPRWNLAIWTFPITGSEGVPARTVAYDYKRGRWYRSDSGYVAMGEHDLSREDVQWDSLSGSMDAQTRIFDSLGTVPEPVILVSDTEGYVYYLAWGVNDNGRPISAHRRTPLVRIGGPGRATEIEKVVVDTTARAGTRCVVSLYGSENGIEPGLLKARAVTVSAAGELTAYFRQAPTWAAVQVANEQSNEELGVISATIFQKARGR